MSHSNVHMIGPEVSNVLLDYCPYCPMVQQQYRDGGGVSMESLMGVSPMSALVLGVTSRRRVPFSVL